MILVASTHGMYRYQHYWYCRINIRYVQVLVLVHIVNAWIIDTRRINIRYMYVHIINARTTDTRRINIIAMYKYYYHFPNSVTLCLIEQAKFSHDDFYTNIHWIFKLNEICISNRNPTNTLTNCIQCAFGVNFLKILQFTWTVIECLRHEKIITFDVLYQNYAYL